MNWIILISLAPLVIVPVVLLCGFAGCAEIAGINDSNPSPPPAPLPEKPTGLKATAVSQTQIDLQWNDLSGGLATYTVFRGGSNLTPDEIATGVTPTAGQALVRFENKGLAPGTTFFYRVKALVGSDKSARSDPASATTLPAPSPPPPVWRTAYPISPLSLTANMGNFAGNTVVQRLNAALLSPAAAGATKVRIVVSSSQSNDLRIDKATISQAALSGNVFDSAPVPAPLAKLTFKGGSPSVLVLRASQELSDPADFAFDPTKDLLVAFKLGPDGSGRARTGVPGAKFFSKTNVDEAEQRDRIPPYPEQADIVYFVEKIEVL